jgi:acetoin:2,6-dichlorophenolindophenol oxidoreductase subunit alpha
VDGNDPVAIYAAAKEAIERARSGGGPTLIEAVTFRFNGHLIGDMGEYIPKAELEAAVANDPYPKYRKWLVDNGHATAAVLDQIDAEVSKQVEEAAAFAFGSPLSDPSEVKRDVYAHELA